MLNTHISRTVAVSWPADFIPTDAPDPDIALYGYIETELPREAAPAVQETASVLCALLIKNEDEWHARPAFKQSYVSPQWVQKLLHVLRLTDLTRLTADLRQQAVTAREFVLGFEPSATAFAIMVLSAGRRQVHVIFEPGEEPPDWHSLLNDVAVAQSLHSFGTTSNYFDALRGDRRAALTVIKSLGLRMEEPS